MNINPHLQELKEDILYHFGIDSRMNLKETFGHVRFVCMGGSDYRARHFAEKVAWELRLRVTTDSVHPIGKTERYELYQVGPILSVSHGMGIGSIRIMLHEVTKLLYHAGVKDPIYIRIGTSGGIGVKPGTVILTEQALNTKLEPKDEVVTLGKTRTYPTQFDPELLQALFNARGTIPVEIGRTLATNDFYEEQTRLDGALDPGYSKQEQQKFLHKLNDMGIKNYEMESTAMAGFCNRAGIRAAAACVTLLDRLRGDQVTATPEELAQYSDNAQNLVLDYLKVATSSALCR